MEQHKQPLGRHLLWAAVSAAGGAYIGSWFGLAGRQLVLPAALLAGVYLLLAVHRLVRNDSREQNMLLTGQSGTAVSRLPAPAPLAELPASTHNSSLNELFAADQKLAPDEAREWLDRFLVEQQS